ncbi:hypothetical protein BDP27DRAFT_523222 [Rhodocollybia butyracea]|uniref:F-box domain-containing protein n=1 Tax=Rhodocollybia butyracea TaxID=206335 RepID=A0A9P5P6E0_9AGAR|nr:hypothetical protein BDP27DRAFT_523222 [Rhodocollybia butyracea]
MSNDTLYRTPVFSARIRVSSAVSTQLCSEFGPGSFTAKDRKDLLIHCDRHCDDYEQEVAHLQSQLLYIRQQQKRLKNHEATLRSQNSPVRKIPNAILEIIFNLACERNLLQEYPWRNATQSPPTTISSPMASLPALSIASTCSRWRKVAMSTPSLWSRLRLEVISGIHLSHHDPFIHAVMLHLRRAQKCPLDIDLYVAGKIRSTCATILILTSVASDWKAFKYDGDLGFWVLFSTRLESPSSRTGRELLQFR